MRSAPSLPNFKPSPLLLCDRLLALAQEADRAGCCVTAEHLFHLAHTVLDERPVATPGPN
jgi:hypothetical protein